VATVHFSRSLRQYTGGVASFDVEAGRVLELVRSLSERFPQLTAPLEIMAISVDGEIYPEPEYVELSPESEVHLVPKIPGG
jgi:hypothetical protein